MAIMGNKPNKKAGDTVSQDCVIVNKLGLHARPAALFVKTSNRFESDITVEKDGEQVNGKSIMGLMMLAAGCGSKIRIKATGADAKEAVHEIEKLITRKFDEE
jgi:phosphocarrier protein